jgi:hypothetical protein
MEGRQMTGTLGVEFVNGGAEAVYRPGNGHAIRYKRYAGIYFHADTPPEVVQALNTARLARTRLRLHFGDTVTGRDWLEEHDLEGTIGNSTGPLKVPLLVPTSRSHGGPALLDHCIVQIKETRSGRVLYRHPNYHTGTLAVREIGPNETCGTENLRALGYTVAVDMDGTNHANFRSRKAAERFVRRMTG